MRSRLLLVGEDFGQSDPQYHTDAGALTGASGRRIASLTGYEGPNAMLLYMLDFERTNVVVVPEDWQRPEVVAAGAAAVRARMPRRLTILLGSRVAAALDAVDADPFVWTSWTDDERGEPIWFARMPHPSGRNHWWNEAENRERAAKFLRSAVATLR